MHPNKCSPVHICVHVLLVFARSLHHVADTTPFSASVSIAIGQGSWNMCSSGDAVHGGDWWSHVFVHQLTAPSAIATGSRCHLAACLLTTLFLFKRSFIIQRLSNTGSQTRHHINCVGFCQRCQHSNKRFCHGRYTRVRSLTSLN